MQAVHILGETAPAVGAFGAAAKLEQLLCVLIKYVTDLGVTNGDIQCLREGAKLLTEIRTAGVAPQPPRPRRWLYGTPAHISPASGIPLQINGERAEHATRIIGSLADSLATGTTPPARAELDMAREEVGDLFAAVVERLGDI